MVRWPVRVGVSLVLSATAIVVIGVLVGWGAGFAVVVVSVALVAGLASLVFVDSVVRGRSGWRWLLGCALFPPVAIPVFLIVAVLDRSRCRHGIEGGWHPAERWYLLAGLVLAVAAAVLVLSPVHVPGESVSVPGASANFPGSCSSALSVSLGGGPYGYLPPTPSGAASAIDAAQATVAYRCSAAGARRVAAGALCLGAALLVSTLGAGMARRRDPRRRPQCRPTFKNLGDRVGDFRL
ncbi:MAG: hypothetical protein ACR2MN_15120 [Acidimicrobiales bacterium]